MSVRAGEKAALYALEWMDTEKAYLGQALQKALSACKVMGADRATAVAYTKLTVENRQAVEYALSQYTKLNKAGRTVRNILRLGTARLLFGSGTDAQAVNGSVELCKATGKGAQAKYVNAVLRNVAQHKDRIPWPNRAKDPVAYHSVRYSWPSFAVEEAFRLLGEEEAHDFLSYRAPQPVTVRLNPHKTTKEDLMAYFKAHGVQIRPCEADDRALSLMGAEDITALTAYHEGLFSLQGPASMIAARQAFCARGTILDLCAAPGGKTCNIAEHCPDAKVYAFDIHPHRVSLIQAQARRLGLVNVMPAQHDATQPLAQFAGQADSVLVDAPCSGLGTANHRPDVKNNKTPSDVAALAAMQRTILDRAAEAVKPGGKLIYCTCTYLQAENEDVVSDFLQRHPMFHTIRPDLPTAYEGAYHKGAVRLWPHRHHTDGFFICTMERQI